MNAAPAQIHLGVVAGSGRIGWARLLGVGPNHAELVRSGSLPQIPVGGRGGSREPHEPLAYGPDSPGPNARGHHSGRAHHGCSSLLFRRETARSNTGVSSGVFV